MSLLSTTPGFGTTGFGGTMDPFYNDLSSGWGGPGFTSTFNRPLGRSLTTGLPLTAGRDLVFSMDIDVIDADNEFIVMAEVPGVAKDKVDVNIENNLLTIKVNKVQMELPTNFFYRTSEIAYGTDIRRIRIPMNCNLDSVKTCFKDGVLCVKFQKEAGAAQARKKLEIQ